MQLPPPQQVQGRPLPTHASSAPLQSPAPDALFSVGTPGDTMRRCARARRVCVCTHGGMRV
eukprot:74326-Pelagomonas_calceolata.AAC.2